MPKKSKVLVLCSRGVNHQDRHLMLDMRQVIPQSKKDCKFDKKDSLTALNELSSLNSCDKCLYFENRKGKVLLMWASNVNGGPSVKFLVTNVHTMADIKLIGNCLRGSRPILSFDQYFDRIPHLKLIKELFIQIFNVPYKHPKSQPFVDHVMTFSYLDGRIWFRNFQILDQTDLSMAEIGPRMVLMPMLILSSSFHGKIIWANYRRPAATPGKSDKPSVKKLKLSKEEKPDEKNDEEEDVVEDSDEYDEEGDTDDDIDDISKYT